MLENNKIFKEASLTQCQNRALNMFEEMLNGQKKIGILRGFAGTGKTFLTALWVKFLEENDWNVVVMTPTGRAAKVLELEFAAQGVETMPRTIHSLIYKIQPIDYSKEQLSLFADVGVRAEDERTFFIVDESSMVGDAKREKRDEGLNFGSGSLLHDILDYVRLEDDVDSKILFVGDPGQLAPILGNEDSPALDKEKLDGALKARGLSTDAITEVELTSILRQQEGSLKQFVNEVRTALVTCGELPKKQKEHVKPLSRSEFLDFYLQLTQNFDCPENAIILAHKNKDVFDYNVSCRNLAFNPQVPIVKGEILLVKRNRRTVDYGELSISPQEESLANGTFIKVVDTPEANYSKVVHLKGGTVHLRFWKARIRRLDSDYTFDVILLQNLLDSDYWQDFSANYKLIESAILVDFQNRMRDKHGIKPQSTRDSDYDRYKRLAEADPYLNALRVNYGYAVTVHNSQGGEWDTVIVDPQNPARDWSQVSHKLSYRRFIYTASTRAKERLYFLKTLNEEVERLALEEE